MKERLNEDGWRDRVEHTLFERFTIEVACKRCRNRLWQSEIEADPSEDNSVTKSLRDRQRQRAPCKCDSGLALNDVFDHGLSDMFSSRIGETNYVKNDSVDFDPAKKKPDRIHGLQSTAFLQGILDQHWDTDSQHSSDGPQTLQDVVQTTCNPNDYGRRLHFPFLVMEAKSSKGGSGFTDIEIQTALPIRNMLLLQHQLQVRCNKMSIPGGPLVWFLANQGELWRVYGCYVTSDERSSLPIWNILPLWNGSINSPDAALQLILIIDYILDWARDIYRPSIMRQLKSITGIGAQSLTVAQDPDRCSAWLRGQDRHTATPSRIAKLNDQNAMHVDGNPSDANSKVQQLSTSPLQVNRYGMIRCCKVLDSRVLGLYINADNLGTMLRGFSKASDAAAFFVEILKLFIKGNKSCVLPSTKALKAIEDTWTSEASDSPALTHAMGRTIVSVQIRFGVSETFELTQELNYVAITEEACTILCSKFPDFVAHLDNLKSVSEDKLISKIREEKEVSKNNILTRCVQGHVLFQHARTLRFKRDGRLKVHIGRVGEAVTSIYKKYKIGSLEPEQPFLRRQSQTQVISCQTRKRTSKLDNHEALVYNAYRRCFCIFTAPQECGISTLDRLVGTIASKFTIKEQVFVVGKEKVNSSSVCLGHQPGWMRDMAEWFISIQPSGTHLDQVRREIKDEALFDLLVLFKEKCWGVKSRSAYAYLLVEAYIERRKKEHAG